MTRFEFGDVVLVRFPFTDQASAKQRPAVVVSSGAYQDARRDVVIIAITSQVRADTFGEERIAKWQEAGLIKPSALKPVLATVEDSLLLRKLGALAPPDRDVVRRVLGAIFGTAG
jgi:mRNA interferase MazF